MTTDSGARDPDYQRNVQLLRELQLSGYAEAGLDPALFLASRPRAEFDARMLDLLKTISPGVSEQALREGRRRVVRGRADRVRGSPHARDPPAVREAGRGWHGARQEALSGAGNYWHLARFAPPHWPRYRKARRCGRAQLRATCARPGSFLFLIVAGDEQRGSAHARRKDVDPLPEERRQLHRRTGETVAGLISRTR